jgi:hypothetical protein
MLLLSTSFFFSAAIYLGFSWILLYVYVSYLQQ